MMTLEEAIKHCKDVALSCTNKECALEHFQLLKWLQEYSNMLEKQGEQNPVEEYNITGISSKKAQGTLGEMIKNLKPVNEVLEQKPIDKVEPKFKVGDIITNGKIIGKVDENENNKYHGWFGYDKDLSVYYADIPDIENWHLWTIQDAKDSDILDCGNDIVIFKENNYNPKDLSGCMVVYCSYNNFYEIGGINPTFYTPATKEQHELLFQKMKEAGYTFDFEKKELKKIVVPIFNIGDTIVKKHNSDILNFGSFTITDITGGKYWYNDRIICDISEQDEWELYEPVRQNPTWSEENEKMFGYALDMIEWYSGKNEDKSRLVSDWLKSIKERVGNFDDGYKVGFSAAKHNQWKPSDAQMASITCAVRKMKASACYDSELVSLYQDLKKLK